MKTIALLSGKGGSGKTTLGLTISSLFSNAGLKTLLIDCDFATNGATFFFEDQLPKGSTEEMISSLDSALLHYHYINNEIYKENWDKGPINQTEALKVLSVSPDFDFLPSVTHISPEKTTYIEFPGRDSHDFEAFQSDLNELNYDIVVLDCQAGYSEILPIILPNTDIHLIVLEPDKVSTSSMRSLYRKISSLISEKHVYQVFNKANEKERIRLKDITFGTMFLNTGALLYDWSIREDYAFSKVPRVDEHLEYSLSVCDVVVKIVNDKEIRVMLEEYSDYLRKKQRDILGRELFDLEDDSTHRIWRRLSGQIMLFIVLLTVALSLTYSVLRSTNVGGITPEIIIGFVALVIIGFAVIGQLSIDDKNDKEQLERRKRIDELQTELRNIETSLKHSEEQ